MNVFAERFVQNIKTEALDHFIVFGEDRLRYLVSGFVNKHYNTHRPHQGAWKQPAPESRSIEPGLPNGPGLLRRVARRRDQAISPRGLIIYNF
jgi:hypothetical protein